MKGTNGRERGIEWTLRLNRDLYSTGNSETMKRAKRGRKRCEPFGGKSGVWDLFRR